MKSLRCVLAVASVALTLPAHAGVNDPPIVIYRASGVYDANPGFATAVFCTNVGLTTEKLTVVVRDNVAAVKANVNVNVASLNTVTLTTRDTSAFTETTNMATGEINTGTVGIAATSVNFVCTVSVVQYATTAPMMTPLHLLRLSPIPSSSE